jgi:opacity protein-like surface antigen
MNVQERPDGGVGRVREGCAVLALALLLALGGPVSASAQAPAGPPPPTSGRAQPDLAVHELLPDIGRIGSQVGFWGGVSFSPYEAGTGFDVGGFIDLPLGRAPGGKFSYEILLGFSESTSEPFVATNPVAFVANLAAGASPEAALAGPPQAPFPVRREVTLNLRLLHISPFSLKWTLTGWGARFRPFLAAGGDFIVVITRVDPLQDESLVFTGTSPFDDALIGGLVAQSPELAERGIPSGQGNLELGAHIGAGFELRLSRAISLNLDYRFTQVGKQAHLQTANAAIGIHW